MMQNGGESKTVQPPDPAKLKTKTNVEVVASSNVITTTGGPMTDGGIDKFYQTSSSSRPIKTTGGA